MANQKKQSEREAPAAAPVKLLAALACFGVAALLVYLAVAAPEANTAMNDIRCVMLGVAGVLAPLLALLLIWVGVLLVFSWRGRRVRVRLRGGALEIEWRERDGHILMTGPAVTVFEGELID